MKTLTIKGFESDAQIQEFISWYCNQGEQDLSAWLQCRHLGIISMNMVARSKESTENGMAFTIEF